ncbi:MAG: hypothetical protein WBA41_28180 [Rivularia sp. (in: cyanobacteria)]
MAAIRKSSLRGKKRWLGRDAKRQDNFKGSSVKEHTSLPPLTKSTPGFLSRQRRLNQYPNPNNSPAPQVNPQRINNKNRTSRNQTAIPVMPDGSKVPMWLMRWNSLHRHTSVATFVLVSATLVVYGLTVYSQHLWSSSYKKLQDLQRDERQLTKHDETLKNQMAQEAEKPHSGLISPTPANTIFLEETTPSSSQRVDKKFSEEPQPTNVMGY